jgi:predicted PurR-regulated permease PerM
MPRPTTTSLSRHVGSLLLIAGIALLTIAKDVLVPIALATLLAVLLTPLVAWLVRRRLPNILAVGVVMGSLTVILLLAGTMFFGQIRQVAEKLFAYRQNIHTRLSELAADSGPMSRAAHTIQALQDELGRIGTHEPEYRPSPRDQSPGKNAVREPKPATQPAQEVIIVEDQRLDLHDLLNLLANSLQPLAVSGLTLLLATFMIIQRVDIQHRFTLLSTWMGERGMTALSTQAVHEITQRIGSYLILQTALNLGAAVLIASILALLGLPNALLWGLLIAGLRFIPYIGITIAGGVTVLFAIAVSPNWVLPLQTLSLFLIVELLMNNLVEPVVLAHGAGLSSLGILIAAAFWTWIWGPMGLFLAIPLTVCLVTIGRHVPSLAYLAILLSEHPETSPSEGRSSSRNS